MLHSHQNIRSNEKLVKSPDILHLLSDYERNAASHSNLPILSIVDDVYWLHAFYKVNILYRCEISNI